MRNISLFILLFLGFQPFSNAQKKILLFSKTQEYRHESITNGQKMFFELAQQYNFSVDSTENADLINEKNLKNYQAVVFLNTSGTILNSRQKNDLQRYLEAGGGFVGIHAASDTEYDWNWYHKMIGGTFESHPSDPNIRSAEIRFLKEIPNKNQTNSENISIEDEFYNFKNIQSDIIPLALLNEATYNGGNMGAFHPVSWIKPFENGRVFYMGLGHQPTIYEQENFRQNIILGLNWVLDSKIDYTKTKSSVSPESSRFQKNTLSTRLDEPIEIAPLPNKKVLIIERKGKIKAYLPEENTTKAVAELDVFTKFEYGLMGISIDPNFSKNQWVYLYYTSNIPADNNQYLVRYTFNDSLNVLDSSSKKIILKVPVKKTDCCHTGGSMAWDENGNLFLSTGDDTNPGDSEGYSPIDFREGKRGNDALSTAANTNDLRGKILRVKPLAEGGYAIPQGNLFANDSESGLTRPEIYVMGCRNPYRISYDKKTKTLYWGDIGPDAGKPNSEKGPEGFVEFNATTKPGNFGWPMFIADNKPYEIWDFQKKQALGTFEEQKPINISPNNTGLKELPLPQKSVLSYSYVASSRFPLLGKGGCNPMAGPVYYSDDFASNTKFPPYFDGKFLAYEWMRDWIIAMDFRNESVGMEKLFTEFQFSHPIDMEFGFDGTLYVLDYGVNWFQANDEAMLTQMEYIRGNRKPVVKITADKKVGGLPLKVQFSSVGSFDPDGDSLTYFWNFGKQNSKLKNPVFTFTKAGEHEVELTISDKYGNRSSQKINIIAGNNYPEISIHINSNKTFNFPNKTVNYNVEVKDKEDGVIGKKISPQDIIVNYSLLDGYDKTLLEQGHQFNVVGLKGKKLIENSDCKACHSVDKPSIGPSYQQVAEKYAPTDNNIDFLSKKIIEGGTGNWGEHYMAAHPQLSQNEASEMVDYILNINKNIANSLPLNGEIPGDSISKTLIIKATYTDQGKGLALPLTTTEQYLLKPNLLNAINADFKYEVGQYVHSYFGYEVTVANANSSYFGFEKIDFTGIQSMRIFAYAEKVYTVGGSMEIRLDSSNGAILGTFKIDVGDYENFTIPLTQNIEGQHDIYFVYKHPNPANMALFGVTTVEFNTE